ncbi:MAG: hypothetical protein ABIJ20_04195 [Nanoarchaeota archaeon]|nr:hypothetical protein [Nanoarchaeota archaeon]MBU1445576.1 hypothetical protein [Nanoarchaeota archaeon]MBU2420743.1 hypothetical protein [Nanoarchaeota archaeon]MBU2475465.1 hypothetical protein [Nanoarchaeota archaeon]
MVKIINMSSEEGVKYITLQTSKDLNKVFQSFLSDIGVSKNERKALFGNVHVYTRAGIKPGNYKETLQVIHNKDKTVNVEIFTGDSLVIMVIHYSCDDILIGNAPHKHFDF